LIHVYAKNYENNGKVLLIRLVRYSLDGLLLGQAVFLAYMVVLKKSVNVGLAAFLILFTAVVKLLMTRMCRGQFEQDDIDEASIVCSSSIQGSGSKDTEASFQKDQTDLNDPVATKLPPQRPILTWRLPEWVNFSYATAQHRPKHARRRQPNPFRPQSQDFTRLNSMSQDVERVTRHASEAPRKSSFSEFPWGGVSPTKEKGMYQPLVEVSGSVVEHHPPVPWDDETTVDLPYDNPYYTKAFANVLWLPRNPSGILDLDETIHLKVSLCVDIVAGQLGSWLGVGETSSPEEMPEAETSLKHQTSQGSLHPVNGTEDIDLPPVIAQRVRSKEHDVEWTLRPRRPSTFRRKFSGATTASSDTGISRRPSAFRGDSSQGVDGRARSSSILSTSPSFLQTRSHILGQSSVLQVPAEVLSAPTNASTSRLSHLSYTHSNNVTTRQAIFNEVLAEERAAMVDQFEDEEADTQKAASGKSWLTAWMFSRQD
ncbi:hypothetical protein DXG01_007035, partial [Tephrocybe rancida]